MKKIKIPFSRYPLTDCRDPVKMQDRLVYIMRSVIELAYEELPLHVNHENEMIKFIVSLRLQGLTLQHPYTTVYQSSEYGYLIEAWVEAKD